MKLRAKAIKIKKQRNSTMKIKLYIAFVLFICCGFLYAQSPFADNTSKKAFQDEDGSVFSDEDFEEGDMANNEHTNKMMFLDSVQKHFWNPKRKLQDNNLNILHKDGDTHMIRTRYAMVTTIIFDNDPIAKVIFGDPNGFELTELGAVKWDLRNIITIKPKLIGIDTNLTIIGESGTIYTFYIFSTHFTNRRDPAFSVFVSKDRKIGKITMSDMEEGKHKKDKKRNDDNYKRIEHEAIEEDDGEFITIGDNVNKIHIEKSKIKRGYAQSPKSTRTWKSLWLSKEQSAESVKIQAIDIFNDNEYTYFKFDREDAMSKFPVVFKVVDGYDNPVNVKIVGNYLVAEDLSEKWTLKMGEEYVCVRMLQKPTIIRENNIENTESKTPSTNNTETENKTSAPATQKNAKHQQKIESTKQESIDSRNHDELIKRNQERIKELEELQKKSKAQSSVSSTSQKKINNKPVASMDSYSADKNHIVFVPTENRHMTFGEFEKLKASGKLRF